MSDRKRALEEINKNIQTTNQKNEENETTKNEETNEETKTETQPNEQIPISQTLKKKKTDQTKKEEIIERQNSQLEIVEKIHLQGLPSGKIYTKSYMHTDLVTHIQLGSSGYLFTASINGQIKVWKKIYGQIEPVKSFNVHEKMLVDLQMSFDKSLICSISKDQTAKIYDVESFDIISVISLEFEPKSCCFVYDQAIEPLIAISKVDSPEIYVYTINGENEKPKKIVKIHYNPITVIAYNSFYNCVISVDTKGMINYWKIKNLKPPKEVLFNYKSETDLFFFAKNQTYPFCLTISPDGKTFACISKKRRVYLFDFLKGKILKEYNESLEYAQKVQTNRESEFHLDSLDFGKRIATENQINKEGYLQHSNIIFDQTGSFLIYGSMFGIKVVNIRTDKIDLIIGKDEISERFLKLCLFQGKVKPKIIGSGEIVPNKPDPTLFCTSFKKNKFYYFTKSDVQDDERDVFNEKPTIEERATSSKTSTKKTLGTQAIIHTSYGDIKIKLYPNEAPKTVENFCTLSKSGYYNNLIWHRIVRGFIIQTGDPNGDGSGGQSCWGGYFEDEFSKILKHDTPGTVSMANAGKGTNGSQFFITTAPASHLDSVHSIFGKVYEGMAVVRRIEKVACYKNGKPKNEIKIISVSIK
ncbi:peptidylprolyl isomerase domain and wd repeat-containing protein [Anaeramoeba flamelloides]|uniref:peptidylprolyl isomerase n=1 Tax=Anaeramoeba flamelloides TaxID=1746091 RepID=A0AAV7ZN84_9EUKA|nr:peptidylprolyl isomerase domain and wd repeat-containing protein [Anaeramoeba flamelloides]